MSIIYAKYRNCSACFVIILRNYSWYLVLEYRKYSQLCTINIRTYSAIHLLLRPKLKWYFACNRMKYFTK